jgi:imidazole glycerol-phosphate synthase subunit HisF
MLRVRVIPCLQLVNQSLVKTVKFGKYTYIGDPINTVRIFNELEVDELCFLDIRATVENRNPNMAVLHEIADECFMPLTYGGGVRNLEQAKAILAIGFEKIVINTAAVESPELITRLAEYSGVQSVVGSIDVKKNLFGKYQVYSHDGTTKTPLDPVRWAKELTARGVGELLITSMDRDGTWSGYDLDLIKSITEVVGVPVIANGGAGHIGHLAEAVAKAKASAVALGSMVVYQKQDMGVLINFPDKNKLAEVL